MKMQNVEIKTLLTISDTNLRQKHGKVSSRKSLDRTLTITTRLEKTESSSSDEDLFLIIFSKKKSRRFGIQPLLQSQNREGEWKLYLAWFWTYFWVSVGQLEPLLKMLASHLRGQDSSYWEAFDLEQRRAVCLRKGQLLLQVTSVPHQPWLLFFAE